MTPANQCVLMLVLTHQDEPGLHRMPCRNIKRFSTGKQTSNTLPGNRQTGSATYDQPQPDIGLPQDDPEPQLGRRIFAVGISWVAPCPAVVHHRCWRQPSPAATDQCRQSFTRLPNFYGVIEGTVHNVSRTAGGIWK